MLDEKDPQREKALDRIRWLVAEELWSDPLNVKNVFAYAIKLAIVARWTAGHP